MYNPILTAIGKAKIANAIATNTTVEFTEMAVGDGNGSSYTPNESQTTLVNETYRMGLSSLYVNPSNPSIVETVGIIPAAIGGFIVREVAIFDTDGDMIAISDFPPFEKIILGAAATPLEIKFLMEITNSNVVTLVVDDSNVYASVQSVQRIDKALKDSNFPNGFKNRTDSAISFDDVTRTFTIQPTASTYNFYVEGFEYQKAAPLSVTIPNTNGMWFICFNETGDLVASQTNYFETGKAAFVAYVYWNTTLGKSVIFGDERHGIMMDKATHSYLHHYEGCRYNSGLIAGNYTLVGTGSSNADAQISLTSGTIQDEDIVHNINHSNTPTADYEQYLTPIAKVPVYYRNGATGIWTKDTATNYPLKVVSNVPQYNLNSSGWSSANVPSTNFYAMWIIATNNIKEPIIAVMGQRVDTTIEDAKANNKFETLNFGDTPTLEFKALYRVVFQYNSSFTNGVKSVLKDILDIRGITAVQVSAITVTNHNDLTARNTNDAHPISAITGLQSALDGKQDTIADGGLGIIKLDIDGSTDIGANLADADLIIVDKGANGTNRKSAISRIWTYISGKLTGAISTVLTTNLTASKALVSDTNGKIANSSVTSTELGYVSGVTSAIQTQIDNKAPLASPTFTGDAKAVTPAQFDNDTSIATTEFIQRALGNFKTVVGLSASTTLTLSQLGTFFYVGNTTAFTLTLPAPSVVGGTLTFFNINSAPVTLSPASGTINYGGDTLSSFNIPQGASVQLISDGSNWYASSSIGKSSLSANGYQKLPSGLIIQWGTATITSGTVVTFPIAFPNACLSLTHGSPQTNYSGASVLDIPTSSITKTQWIGYISVQAQGGGSWSGGTAIVSYMAIGY